MGSGGVATGGTGIGGRPAGGTSSGGTSDDVPVNGGSSGSGASGGVGGVGDLGPLQRVVPFQTWKGPGASVTGILFAMVSEEYGPALDWARGIVANTPPQPYWFGSNGSSPYALYFPSTGEGVNFLVEWQVNLANGAVAKYDAAMFRPDTVNPWGLSADAHIVTLEVNDGQGSNSGVHFVATDVEILDGTPEVPMDLVAVMSAARADFTDSVQALDPEIVAELESARQQTMPPSSVTFTRTQAQGLWPTWRVAPKQLELTFVHRRDESWRIPLQTLPDMSGAAPNPAVPVPIPPRQGELVYHYHVEYLVTYRIDATGETIETETFGPTAVIDPQTRVPL